MNDRKKDHEEDRGEEREEQVIGQVPKQREESDPIGVNSEGGVTTNEDGDPPGSDLEVEEQRTVPDTQGDRKDDRPVVE